MNKVELNKILELHRKWLIKDDGERADLCDADLRGAELCGADLIEADLSYANLRNANLIEADLRNADLRNANLRGANLRWANLRNADLRGADLRDADLLGVNLSDANLPHTFARLQLAGYTCDIWPNKIRVGCQLQDIRWWKELAEEKAEKMAIGGGDWIKRYKPIILATAEAIKKGGQNG